VSNSVDADPSVATPRWMIMKIAARPGAARLGWARPSDRENCDADRLRCDDVRLEMHELSTFNTAIPKETDISLDEKNGTMTMAPQALLQTAWYWGGGSP